MRSSLAAELHQAVHQGVHQGVLLCFVARRKGTARALPARCTVMLLHHP